MNHFEKADIYLDLRGINRLLKRAQFLATKQDRIAYITPAMEAIRMCIHFFILCYDLPCDRIENAQRLYGHFMVVRADIDDMWVEDVLTGRDVYKGKTADQYKLEITEHLAKIDKGISRYVSSVISLGKTEG